MPRRGIVLIGQGGWVRSLATGLASAGLNVRTAPLDSVRQAADVRTWLEVARAAHIVRIGFRPGANTWRGRAFDLALAVVRRGARVSCYWIGTDVMTFAADVTSGARVAAWRSPALSIDHHLAGSEPLRIELAALGISSQVLGFPWRTVEAPTELPPLPDDFRVVSYVPDGRAEFYGGPVLMEVARRMPSVWFEIMGGSGSWAADPPPNVQFLGWVDDPARLYATSSCVVRLTEHDSIGGTAVEGLLFGRPVLYTQMLDHTVKVDMTTESVEAALATLLARRDEGRLVPDQEAARWARTAFDHVARFEALAACLRSIGSQRQHRLTYLTHQSTSEGQAAHAHVHEIVKGLAANGWSTWVVKPRYRPPSPSAVARLMQFARIQATAVAGLRRGDAFYIRSHFAALPVARLARVLRTPVVQEVNGPHADALLAWPGLRRVRPVLELVNRSQLRMADAVITVTPQLVSWIQRDAGVDRVHLVPNGADTELFVPRLPAPPGLPKRYVVFFGALAPWQGIAVALEATRSPQWPEGVALVVVGDGQLRGEVEEASADGRAVYLGRQPYREIPAIVGNALASLVPMPLVAHGQNDTGSRDHSESGLAPLKLYESMACGVPVIASNLPGLSDTIRHADCGVLVSPGNADELAEAVRSLDASPLAAREMGERGRESAVREHSWRGRADDTAAILRAITH